jgi:hypothetical protein
MERRPLFRFITGVTEPHGIRTRTITALPTLTLWLALAFSSAPVAAQVRTKGLPGRPADSTRQQRRPATGVIDGFVGDTALRPLSAAEVKILSTSVAVHTGPNGRFRMLDVPAGQYVLVLRRSGYRPTSVVVEVAAADTLRLSYTLERGATMLEAAVVTTPSLTRRMTEFESRRKFGRGEFLDEAEINKRNAVYATDLMRRFTSVNVSPNTTKSSGGMPEQYALSRREGGTLNGNLSGGGGGYCAMTVFVDDVKMPTPFNLDLLPSPRILAGIEVYAGSATAPPRWAGFDTGCGIILVWTKDQ